MLYMLENIHNDKGYPKLNNRISGNVKMEYLQITYLTEDFCLEYLYL